MTDRADIVIDLLRLGHARETMAPSEVIASLLAQDFGPTEIGWVLHHVFDMSMQYAVHQATVAEEALHQIAPCSGEEDLMGTGDRARYPMISMYCAHAHGACVTRRALHREGLCEPTDAVIVHHARVLGLCLSCVAHLECGPADRRPDESPR